MPYIAHYYIRIRGHEGRFELGTTEHSQDDIWFAMQQAEEQGREILKAAKTCLEKGTYIDGSFEICLVPSEVQLTFDFVPKAQLDRAHEVLPDLDSPEYWLNPEAPTLRDLQRRVQ